MWPIFGKNILCMLLILFHCVHMQFFSQHDPITSFAKETCLTPPTSPSLPYNVDKKFVYIAPSLCLAGFGGSLPAYLRNGQKFWESKNKRVIHS